MIYSSFGFGCYAHKIGKGGSYGIQHESMPAHADIVQPASVHVLMKIRKKQQKHPMRFSALTGLQCNHAPCLGKQAYHAAGIIALRRLHRQRTTSGKNSRFAQKQPSGQDFNLKPKTKHTLAASLKNSP